MSTDIAIMTLDHSARTGVITVPAGPTTSALDLAVDALPEGWHLCAFSAVELFGVEAAAELAELECLPAGEWEAWGHNRAEEVMMWEAEPSDSPDYRVSGHPTDHDSRCASWHAAPVVQAA